jgi:hypothetical protein
MASGFRDDPKLGLIRSADFDAVAPRRRRGRPVFRMDCSKPRLAERILFDGTIDFVPLSAHEVEQAVGSRGPDNLRYRIYDGLGAPLAVFEETPRQQPVVNVSAGPVPAGDSVGILLRLAAADDPAIFTAMVAQPVFALVRSRAFQASPPHGLGAIPVFRMNQSKPIVAAGGQLGPREVDPPFVIIAAARPN